MPITQHTNGILRNLTYHFQNIQQTNFSSKIFLNQNNFFQNIHLSKQFVPKYRSANNINSSKKIYFCFFYQQVKSTLNINCLPVRSLNDRPWTMEFCRGQVFHILPCILRLHSVFMFFKVSSPPSIISTIFALLLVIEKSVCVDPYFETCSLIQTCGGLNISFPFLIFDLQQPYCGYPSFQVSCFENATNLRISSIPLIVHQIFYQSQTLRVSNALASG